VAKVISAEPVEHFLDRVAARDITVGVVGLGYAGLPLAVACAEAGFTTTGHDIDAARCADLNRGQSHVADVKPEALAAVLAARRFTATASGYPDRLPDVVFVCVATRYDGMPDLSHVEDAARAIASRLRPGVLVVVQSTSYPGTTTEVVQPILEASGLRAGDDFSLAFAGERADTGNEEWTVHTTPRVVSGLTSDCTSRARAVLGAAVGDPDLISSVSSPAAAEFVKLLENSYRLVNIALVNEMAVLAHRMGIDINEVIDGAATKPFGFEPFRPGLGAGGACIPEVPLFLAWKARSFECETRMLDLASQVCQGMARYAYQRILEVLGRSGKGIAGSRILCVGAAFKPGTPDIRHSRALRVMELLKDAGALIDYLDPLVPSVQLAGGRLDRAVLDDLDPHKVDLVAILVPNPDLDLRRFTSGGALVFDAVNALSGQAGGHVERLRPAPAGDPRPTSRPATTRPPPRASAPASPSSSWPGPGAAARSTGAPALSATRLRTTAGSVHRYITLCIRHVASGHSPGWAMRETLP
jgi:UDP-N-acetyl-D-glucosamine dehydrogenase